MAVQDAAKQFTLMDIAQRGGAGVNKINTINILTQINKMFEDGVWDEANNGVFHKYKTVEDLPVGTWRLLNQGVQRTKANQGQATETLGILRGISTIDEDEFDGRTDRDAYRTEQDRLAIEGLSQQLMQTIIYGDPTGTTPFAGGPGAVLGLAPRFNSKALKNVHNGGGSANRTSIWIVQWEKERMSFLYPKGAPHGGIDIEDGGKEKYGDETKGYYWAWTTKFKSTLGILPADTRCIQRIGDIDSTAAFNEDLVIDALNRMPNPEKAVIYCNRTMLGQIQKKIKAQSNHFFGNANSGAGGNDAFGGRPAPAYLFGVPVKLVERISNAESAMTS